MLIFDNEVGTNLENTFSKKRDTSYQVSKHCLEGRLDWNDLDLPPRLSSLSKIVPMYDEEAKLWAKDCELCWSGNE